jgi:hypothetical protein
MSIETITLCTTQVGRRVEWVLIFDLINNLMVNGFVTSSEHYETMGWLTSYKNGGALPGSRKFRSPKNDERVFFLTMLDHVMDMYDVAMHEALRNVGTFGYTVPTGNEENVPPTNGTQEDPIELDDEDISDSDIYENYVWGDVPENELEALMDQQELDFNLSNFDFETDEHEIDDIDFE